jgi:hypothetical protein
MEFFNILIDLSTNFNSNQELSSDKSIRGNQQCFINKLLENIA